MEGGEFFDEFGVLVPAFGDCAVVELVAVGEPEHPQVEALEEEVFVVGCLGGPGEDDGWLAWLLQSWRRVEAVGLGHDVFLLA
ncbi:MAG: hypothetical protein BGO38_09810 [Cellulomonas sp. 73-145]|nr:MAG: hypothetical protein BGO38_09810 [Cellulomonas sp. 73-145]